MNQLTNGANIPYNITTLGTTVIPGKYEIIRIIINTKGASSNSLKIYDSNETIGANPQRLKATIDTTVVPGPWEYGFPVFDGIYIVTASGTQADVTLIYKPLI